jgi:hypothetical protein
VVLGLVIAIGRWKGQPVFTDRDWRFLFGHPREKVFTTRLWLRFAVLWLTVVLVFSPATRLPWNMAVVDSDPMAI